MGDYDDVKEEIRVIKETTLTLSSKTRTFANADKINKKCAVIQSAVKDIEKLCR